MILDPANGMLFIEVKGGTLLYNKEFSFGKRIKKNGQRYELKNPPLINARGTCITSLTELSEKGLLSGWISCLLLMGMQWLFHIRYEGLPSPWR